MGSQDGELHVCYVFKGQSVGNKNWFQEVHESGGVRQRCRQAGSPGPLAKETPTRGTVPLPSSSLSESPPLIQPPQRRAEQGGQESPSPCPGEGPCCGLECLQGQALRNTTRSHDTFFCHSLFLYQAGKELGNIGSCHGTQKWNMSQQPAVGHLAKHKVAVNVLD